MSDHIPPPQPLDDPMQVDDDTHNNRPTRTLSLFPDLDMYQPPISCISLTDINPATPNLPPPRSILVVLRMPRVPFIVNRVTNRGTTVAVTCGVVPLCLCHNYDGFIFELSLAVFTCVGLPPPGRPTLERPIPGYDLWYEMMGPVERRVALGRHSWEVFKSRVRLLVLQALI